MDESRYNFELVLDRLSSGDHEGALKDTLPYANAGDSYAQCMMGFLYQVGLGVPRDTGEAERWLLKATEQDNPVAWNNLGSLYLLLCCDSECIPETREKARQCYVRAKELGFNCAFPYPPPISKG